MSQVTQMLVILAMGLVVFFIYVPGMRTSKRLQGKLSELDTRIQEAQRELSLLTTTAESLSKDPDAVLRFARDSLNLAKPDEMVFRFEPYQTQHRPPTPPGH
jgi:cell division protein FtsB